MRTQVSALAHDCEPLSAAGRRTAPTSRVLRPAARAARGALLLLVAAGAAPLPAPAEEPVSAQGAALAPTPAPAQAAETQPDPCPEQAPLLGALGQLLERRPDDATLHYWRARAWAQCGVAAGAAAALADVERLGAGFLPVRDEAFAPVWDDPAFRERVAALAAALPRVEQATEAFRLGRRDLIPEGVAWDAGARRLLVGSLATGEIIAVEPDGGERRFAGPFADLPQVLGIAVDSPRRRVYAVATSALTPREGVAAANAVVELDADSGALLRRLAAADAGQLNDVAIAPDGALFATDSAAGGIWRAGAGDSALARWPSPELALGGANGVAVAAGGESLFVAHATGVARIAIPSGELLPRLGNDTRETLAAIDGLYARGNTLIGVQNVTNPGRVVELTLDADGTRVTAVRTLLSHHHPALAEPTTGAVDGDRLLLLANSHVGRLQPDGTVREPETIPEPVILAVPLPPLAAAEGQPAAGAPAQGDARQQPAP